jgi:hypothetical protein
MDLTPDDLMFLRRVGIPPHEERALAETVVTELRKVKKITYKNGYNAGQQAEKKAQQNRPSFFRGPQ